jgi:hypothetical protein
MTTARIIGGIYSLDVEQDGERTVAYPGSLLSLAAARRPVCAASGRSRSALTWC